ncbi:DUF397 domain-containing protein [Nocardia farcinica]|nr:DUF397 domain-containing protein [Nocardia farcinica]MBF6263244.1 DUF397 domain-containing protein [Nocardia farcinica]MBF6281857.1 DUF397 domain-containing protein [Nocardia farcinica]MBF6306729.1 DUF397 domain-containing protein [Nocardia farcinica]MBF6393194.1 DUF397 domain-containing protein [Nocardia farcinica]MBF6444615.1 DUF397 domain-containing protein [Nocardia farcinica]
MSVDLSGARWFKSTHSSAGSECVEVAHLDGGRVGVRDSKNPDDGVLVFTASEWDAFLTGARAGEFDRP